MNKLIKGYSIFAKYLGVAGIGAGVAAVIEYGAHVEIIAIPVVAAVLCAVATVILNNIKKENN